jgi:hypothetical protein
VVHQRLGRSFVKGRVQIDPSGRTKEITVTAAPQTKKKEQGPYEITLVPPEDASGCLPHHHHHQSGTVYMYVQLGCVNNGGGIRSSTSINAIWIEGFLAPTSKQRHRCEPPDVHRASRCCPLIHHRNLFETAKRITNEPPCNNKPISTAAS